MASASSTVDARTAVVDVILGSVTTGALELVLTHEIYTLAARKPDYRDITTEWMSRSRATLERHFDPLTARMLDALIEGLSIYRALDHQPCDPAAVELAVGRVTQR